MLQSRHGTPDLLAEASEFRELSRILADDPLLALRRLVEVARRLCNAGSASVSLLRRDAAGREIVCWEVISGALASYEGTDLQQASSPCGLCLSAGTTVVVSRPERAYMDLRNTRPAIIEDLIVPLYDNARKPLGTLWIAHHDDGSHFCSDDARIVEQLAVQAVLALKLLEHARKREHAEASASETRRELALKETAIRKRISASRTRCRLQQAYCPRTHARQLPSKYDSHCKRVMSACSCWPKRTSCSTRAPAARSPS